MYCIIDPFTNKVIEFSSFKNDSYFVNQTTVDEDGHFKLLQERALCVEIPNIDVSLLNKSYNSQTNTFE